MAREWLVALCNEGDLERPVRSWIVPDERQALDAQARIAPRAREHGVVVTVTAVIGDPPEGSQRYETADRVVGHYLSIERIWLDDLELRIVDAGGERDRSG